jgi:ubiquinone/menaquinone biosynthesis C-methylase UbiE
LKYINAYNKIDRIVRLALEVAVDMQPFDNYYVWRAEEFKNLFALAGIKFQGRVLEVGCGNAFNSALIAQFSNSVIATDLEKSNQTVESLGIEKAKSFMAKLKIKNCTLLCASTENLPFLDNSFDIVYSNYTLEHVKHKKIAVKEMTRVVKPGGAIIMTVPNFMERVTYVPVYYLYVLKRIFFHTSRIFRAFAKNNHRRVSRKFKEMVLSCDPRIALEGNPNFPFPDIHGYYDSFFHEFASYFSCVWSKLFDKDRVTISKVFNTILLPWHLISLLYSRLPLWLYIKFAPLQRKIGGLPLLNIIGHNVCFIYIKKIK